MPRRSKKSQAATRRNVNKTNNDQLTVGVLNIVRGTFHQGDFTLFSAESVGRQCSCNALVMLCTIEHVFDVLMPCHLDQMLQIGDQLYKRRCAELEVANTLHSSKILDQTQLPDKITIDDCLYTIDYKHEHFRHGILHDDQSELNTWLQYAFSVSNRNILILDGYMMAVYQHVTGQFVFFDSHSRNEIGLMAQEGTSIVLFFENFQNLLNYLLRLIPTLGAKYFGIQPIVTHSSMQESDTNQRPETKDDSRNSDSNNPTETNMNPEGLPSCST